MHRKKYRGDRDLSDLEFSGAYGTWRPKKRQKTKIIKIAKIAENIPGRRTICLLIGQPLYKCVAESNKSLGLHRLLNPTTHDTNYGHEFLDPTVCMHFAIYLHRGAKPPPPGQLDCKMHAHCWIQQVMTIVSVASCWIQQSM